MTEVKILVEGYVSGEENNKSCSTISLIKGKDTNIVVDPGTLNNRQILIDALEKEGLKIEDIAYVFITHSHMDHYRNIGMFPNAKALDCWGIWDKDTVKDWDRHFTDDIEIIKTPGHDATGLTFLIRTGQGTIAIVGDVFWKEDFPEDDPYAGDKESLKKSRKLVREKADFIIPGHANMFEVKKNQPRGKRR